MNPALMDAPLKNHIGLERDESAIAFVRCSTSTLSMKSPRFLRKHKTSLAVSARRWNDSASRQFESPAALQP
jgi:hypothetical protein